MSAYNSLLVHQSSPIFSFNRGGVAVDQVHFQFSLCGSVPETFVIKVESCEKSGQILDVFSPPKFCWGQTFQN